uniref:Secreted protein n=1 Tax=Rhipicephalus zambeziensis TaxID=60191 RepID=A0A224YKL4_9ACAR
MKGSIPCSFLITTLICKISAAARLHSCSQQHECPVIFSSPIWDHGGRLLALYTAVVFHARAQVCRFIQNWQLHLKTDCINALVACATMHNNKNLSRAGYYSTHIARCLISPCQALQLSFYLRLTFTNEET